jgi:hypothetical protein
MLSKIMVHHGQKDKHANVQFDNDAAVTGMQRIPIVPDPKTQALFATTLIANAPP